ncbi:MAG: hypothetical protein PF450_07725 [Bacteroidales bacterium]|jgi:hypothetical protein|nr:hypothetical protein [Bacteroidales bacterium]
MPKIIIDKRTLKVSLKELDKWEGKLTWDLYRSHLARVLGIENISRHTLLSYAEIKQAFDLRKQVLRDEANKPREVFDDVTLEWALTEIKRLESEVGRLESTVESLREQFARWQYNLYLMPGVDMDRLQREIDKPLPANQRSKKFQ